MIRPSCYNRLVPEFILHTLFTRPMRRGIATFTLDHGHCPPWLFNRMVRLAREMVTVLVDQYGPDEFISRIADPVWFQSLGTVLAFDWNASGLTTVLTGALKEAIRYQEKDLGIFICGGKGKTSRKTPDQIVEWGQRLNFSEDTTNHLVYSSKMSAKVDSSLVQDGYQLYHHTFFFSRNGACAVVQQGMNTHSKTARRYHWYIDEFKIQNSPLRQGFEGQAEFKNESEFDFVNKPHTGIASQGFQKVALNLVAEESKSTRDLSTELVAGGYATLMKDIEILRKHSSSLSKMITFQTRPDSEDGAGKDQYTLLKLSGTEFSHHPVEQEDFTKSKYLEKILQQVADAKPKTYEELVALKGVGPKTVRALALVSEVIYGAVPSYEDPARYSFAHGGKDETPYPVDRQTYDQTITMLGEVVKKTRLNPLEKDKILARIGK